MSDEEKETLRNFIKRLRDANTFKEFLDILKEIEQAFGI